MFRKQFLNLREINEILNQSSDEDEINLKDASEIDITILPPSKVDEISDQEDIDENEHNINNADTLPTEIAGEVELLCAYNNESQCGQLMNEEPSVSQPVVPKWSTRKRDNEFSTSPVDISKENYKRLHDSYNFFNPMELYKLFIDDEIIDFIVDSTNRYSHVDKNDTTFNTNYTEIQKFIGILYLTGVNRMPNLRMYWSENPALSNKLIRENMTRERFKRIKSNIHMCNNAELDKEDKFAKLTPLHNMLNKNFMQFGVFSHELSIDEQMVAYYGRHSCKMYIKGKPIRFGYKFWCLCSTDGYLFQFIPYAGSSAKKPGYGLGENVVMNLLKQVDKPNQHTITFDNFFTSYKLLVHLSSLGYFATGTVRENRTSNAKLSSPKIFKKKERGSYDYCYDPPNEIAAVRWNDNSVVTVLSNYVSVEPLKQAKRYDRKNKKMINIPMPNAIHHYNKTMGGVDLFDNAINNYRIQVRGKKWYWPLFTNAIDAALVNAWKLHCVLRKEEKTAPISQLEFRMFVIECLLQSENVEKIRSKSVTVSSPLSPVRTDRIDHNIVRQDRRLRCRQCNSQTVYKCGKCNVAVHPKCFDAYHN